MFNRKTFDNGNAAMRFVVESGCITGCITGEEDCTQLWHLRLEEFAFPQVGRVVERLEGSYEELREQLHAREQAIQGITLDLPDAAIDAAIESADSTHLAEAARVQAQIAHGRCPYCGNEQELDYSSWYLLGSEDELNPRPDEDLGEYIDRRVTFEQLEGRTFYELRDCPAGKPSALAIDAGFEPGETPLAKLEHCLEHPHECAERMWHSQRDEHMRHAWWRIGSLTQGYCKCSACGNFYHVGTSECTTSGHADHTPLLEQRYVDAEIQASEDTVAVHFEPAIGMSKCSDLRFCIDDGTVEVNGKLAFGAHVLPAGEGVPAARHPQSPLLDDIDCFGLLDEIAELLCKRIEGFEEALCRVELGRRADYTQVRVKDMAVANRFRGYPIEFYHQVYDQAKSEHAKTLIVRENASVLPLYYADLEECFKQSCLPDTPAIRATAFARPWLIALAYGFKHMPFEDERVLEHLLSDPYALDTLTALVPFESAEGTVLGYLIERFGEDTVCGLFTHESMLARPRPWTGFLKRKVPAELPPQVTKAMAGMPLEGVAYVLSELEPMHSSDDDLCPDLEPFEYPESSRALEGEMGPAHLELAERPIDILVASVELGEGLAEYTQLMLEEDMSSHALLLARNKYAELVGAVAVDLWKGAAQLYKRMRAAGSEELTEAFEAWMQKHELEASL